MNINLKKLNEKNAYLIGSKPESMKMDIIMFKEEVLVELKQLNNSLAEKYRKISQEVQDKLELFDKKLTDYNIKLSELSTKIIIDTKSHEKINELLIFKDKAHDIMTSNKIKISLNIEETRNSIDRIYSLLKESVLYPGVIGNNCKFKCFHEYIDYTLLQIAIMNNFKEKNTMDLGLYKEKIGHLFDSMKMKMDSDIRAINYLSTDIARKAEKRLIKELGIRDEKLQNMRIENQEYILKLNKEVKDFIDEFNLIKRIKNDIEEELKIVKKNNIDYINNIFKEYNEKNNKFENGITELSYTINKAVNFLNREAKAEIKTIKIDEILSSNDNAEINCKSRERKSIIYRSKSSFDVIKENIYSSKSDNTQIKNNKNNLNNYFMEKRKNESAKDRNKIKNDKFEEKKNQKEKPKSSKRFESDISRYVKGEIKANEIGSLSKFHHKNQIMKNNEDENKEFIKQLKEKNELKKQIHNFYLARNRKKMIYNLNKALDKSFDNKIEKTKNKMKTNVKDYQKIMGIELNDIDAQYHGNNISSNSEYKDIIANDEITDNKNKTSINFKKNLGGININQTKTNNSNNDKNKKKNYLHKNLSLLSSDTFDNINLQSMPYNGSYNNLFSYNNNSLMNFFHPFQFRKNLLKFNQNNNFNIINNNTIDSKIYQSPKMKINNLSSNIFPLELNNNNSIFHINSFSSFSQDKNKKNMGNNKIKIISNIKASFNNKNKNYLFYKNYKTYNS